MISILLAEDHSVVRLGVRTLLQAQPDLTVVGEVEDGLDVLPAVERFHPHVLLLDLMMPGLNGLEVIRQVTKRAPETRVVVLSMHANEAYVAEALHNGAAGYVLKGSDADDIIRAVRTVLGGGRFLSTPLSERTVAAYAESTRGEALDLYDMLTTREREIFQLSAEGHTSTQIAARLYISPRTVETHRANLLHKLGLRTQTDLVRYAIRRGIVSLDEN